ncbi:MAG: DUF1343 domain-containing protein [Verrucomicrobia bacterium]|nr:DUF1343 domain-containing protein [Verrucomicrobiota bacterium]
MKPPAKQLYPWLTMVLAVALQLAPNLPAEFAPARLAEMDDAIKTAIAENKCPGGVLWFEHGGETYSKAFGKRALVPAVEEMTEDTIFDAASLTKVVACTPAVMLLIERGKIGLDDRVAKYIPEFAAESKGEITIRHLLTHTSGLRPDISLKPDWSGYDAAISLACVEKLATKPGEKFTYSDTGPIVLGEIVRRVAGKPLDEFLSEQLYTPLRMTDTGFNPLFSVGRPANFTGRNRHAVPSHADSAERSLKGFTYASVPVAPHPKPDIHFESPVDKLSRIAPTEVENGKPMRGVVHDPRARRMGGVAGHAGLFTTASDLARYARMLLNSGELDGVRVFKPETVKLMTSVQTPANVNVRRGLGWDIDSNYSGPRGKLFPLGSFGHTGWTGTSIWVDPFSKSFVIFLSNRNHPNESGNVIALRARLGTLAAEAITDFNFASVPGALPPRQSAPTNSTAQATTKLQTLNGIDVLARQNFAPLRGKRVGLITNHTGHDHERNATIDLLSHAPGVTLVALFSPEHGIRGAVDEKVSDSSDEKTGLPVFSLYGETRKPKPEQLQNVDVLVFDIQDIGCRFYTYASTLGLALEAASESGKPIFVLDRVNPINGRVIDGPVLTEKTSFVGFHQIPLRHGMTLGELAKMFNAERNSKANLTVIPCENWSREMWFDETGLPWTNPSPNMRNLTEAILYPGVGLLESAVSVGRGTDTPFEVVGAPYVDDVKFAAELNIAALPGVRFVPIRFTPAASVHKGKLCGGVYIALTDRNQCNVVDLGLLMALTLQRMYPADFPLEKIKHLLLHDGTLQAIRENKSLTEIRASWRMDLVDFEQRRERYLIYR